MKKGERSRMERDEARREMKKGERWVGGWGTYR